MPQQNRMSLLQDEVQMNRSETEMSRYSLSVGRAVGGSVTDDCTLSTLGSVREGRGALGAGGRWWLLFSTALLGTKPSGCLKTGISGLLEAPSTGLMIGDVDSALL